MNTPQTDSKPNKFDTLPTDRTSIKTTYAKCSPGTTRGK